MEKIKYIFCHGFGFSSEFFQPLIDLFHPDEIINYDLGYFSNQYNSPMPKFDENTHNYVGIGHSFGFHKLVAGNFNVKFKFIVGINAFTNFLGKSPALYKKRKYEYKIFQKQFLENPISTIKHFYQRCGFNNNYLKESSKINFKKLYKDLEALTSILPINNNQNLLIINSMNDLVVSPKITYDNFNSYSNIKLIMMKTGKHKLPYSNPETIYKEIINFRNELKEKNKKKF